MLDFLFFSGQPLIDTHWTDISMFGQIQGKVSTGTTIMLYNQMNQSMNQSMHIISITIIITITIIIVITYYY